MSRGATFRERSVMLCLYANVLPRQKHTALKELAEAVEDELVTECHECPRQDTSILGARARHVDASTPPWTYRRRSRGPASGITRFFAFLILRARMRPMNFAFTASIAA
jgi:hypothetical protein